MKFSLTVAFLFVANNCVVDGFAPLRPLSNTALTSLSVRSDSSDLVKEALEISKKFGAASPEARLAWEAVEEVDASDNSEATKGNLAEDCDIDDVDQACMEYNAKMEELQNLIKAQRDNAVALKSMVETVKKVKLTVPEMKAGPSSPELKKALAEAKKLTEEKGLDSPEARVAWDTVEEIAGADNSGALGGMLSEDECLVDAAQEACEALEELSRLMESRKVNG